ncbi:MAG: hypothetical protein AB1634_06985 [Thermodesulfobacteriota bacterium]
MDDAVFLVAVHPLSFLGQQVLSDRWSQFRAGLRTRLLRQGREDPESSEELLLFLFNHPLTAISAFFESLDETRKAFGWPDHAGPAPVHVIFHLERKGDERSPVRILTSQVWDFLEPATPYITRALKNRWPEYADGGSFPAHTLDTAPQGLFRLRYSAGGRFRTDSLFPHRRLLRSAGGRLCFYCGMTGHRPALCPSKYLAPDLVALPEAGFMTATELAAAFRAALDRPEETVRTLAAGIDAAQLRDQPPLTALVAYFDLGRVFQIRFLLTLAFTPGANWPRMQDATGLKVTNKQLFVGLDCLRVGKYREAGQLLLEKNKIGQGVGEFFAQIGLALAHLEQDQDEAAQARLRRAHSLAPGPREQTYIQMLLSRFHEIVEQDLAKADHAVSQVFAINRDCLDASYRKIQLAVRQGTFGERDLKTLRVLVESQKELYCAALMDPDLEPVQAIVEDMLTAVHHATLAKAREGLAAARVQAEDIVIWFGAGDDQVKANQGLLSRLEAFMDRQSFYGLLEVASRAKGMVFTCDRLREDRTEALKNTLKDLQGQWQGIKAYWDRFPYQGLFGQFGDTVNDLFRSLHRARSLILENKGPAFREASELVSQVEAGLVGLRPLVERMNWVRNAVEICRDFGKRLLACEAVLFFLALAAVPLSGQLLPAGSLGGLPERLLDPGFQKEALVLLLGLVAPVFALLWTLADMRGQD